VRRRRLPEFGDRHGLSCQHEIDNGLVQVNSSSGINRAAAGAPCRKAVPRHDNALKLPPLWASRQGMRGVVYRLSTFAGVILLAASPAAAQDDALGVDKLKLPGLSSFAPPTTNGPLAAAGEGEV